MPWSVPSFADRLAHKQNNFDLLRLMFALGVLYGHAYGLSGNPGERVGVLSRGQIDSGGFSVMGFFVLSGFLITGSWLRTESLVEYARRRAKRILPGFLVAVFFTFLVLGPLASGGFKVFLADPRSYRFLSVIAFKSPPVVPVAFVANPVPGNLNGSLWTIRIEITCYALVALAGMAGVLRRPRWALLLAVGAVAFALAAGNPAMHRHLNLYEHGLISLASPFAVGAVLFLFASRIPHSWAIFGAVVAALVVATAAGGLRYLLVPCGAYAILFLGLFPGSRWTNAGAFGDFSYGLYLYAFPVQQLIVKWTGPAASPAFVFLTAVPVALTLAVLSWRYVERPFLDHKVRSLKAVEPTSYLSAADPRPAEVHQEAVATHSTIGSDA